MDKPSCGHSLEEQQEITKDEYTRIRMSCYRNQDKMEQQNKVAREGAERYGVPATDKDDAMSIFGKVVGLNKQQIIRLFSEMGWVMYWRWQKKIRAKGQDGFIEGEDVKNTPPEVDDLEFFNQMELLVALARGIPHGFRMEMHPKFKEFSYFFTPAIFQFAYCYPHVNYDSQRSLCWLFDGVHRILETEGMKELALLEAEEILKRRRER